MKLQYHITVGGTGLVTGILNRGIPKYELN